MHHRRLHPQPLRILIIEDHADSRAALERLLHLHGHYVFAVESVAAARSLAANFAIDLVIADIDLPDGDGCDLMRMLRETYGMPVIAVSGYADDEHRRRAVAAGVSDHLSKPIAFEDLEAAIERCRLRPSPPAPRE